MFYFVHKQQQNKRNHLKFHKKTRESRSVAAVLLLEPAQFHCILSYLLLTMPVSIEVGMLSVIIVGK
jgi:hypothetical protein